MSTTNPARSETASVGWIRFAFYCPCDGIQVILYGQYADDYLEGFIEGYMEEHAEHGFKIAEYPERIEE